MIFAIVSFCEYKQIASMRICGKGDTLDNINNDQHYSQHNKHENLPFLPKLKLFFYADLLDLYSNNVCMRWCGGGGHIGMLAAKFDKQSKTIILTNLKISL